MRPQKRPRKRVILDSDDDSEKPSSQISTTSLLTGTPKPTETSKSKLSQRSTRSATSSTAKRGKASSLHTFFNSRTQAQGAGSLQSSGVSIPDEDIVDLDDIEEDENVGRGSTRGKRKFTPVNKRQESDENAENSPSTPFRSNPESKSTARPASNSTHRPQASASQKPWVDLFPPLDRQELAVHDKKVGEVDEWLRSASTGHQYRRLLILKGPAGSGKTATVSILCKARNLQLVEWSNPSNTTYGDDDFQSASTQFDDFLGRSAPFASLTFDDATSNSAEAVTGGTTSGRITLIEEVHVIARWSTALVRFRETIMMHLSSPISHPVVIILSEEDNTSSNAVETMTAHSLLGPDILQHPAVSIIEFNPAAPTFVSNALDHVIKKEARLSGRRRIPGPSLLRALAETGDIRSAIGMLEMMCLNGNDETLSGRVASKGSKVSRMKMPLTAAEQATLSAISQRESSVGLFHAVGKVVYNKREDPATDQPSPFHAEHARPLSSVVDADDLFAHAATDVDTFVAALHENYALSCEADDPLSHIEGCLENLSDADIMVSFDPAKGAFGSSRGYFQGFTAVDETRHIEMVFNTAVRGVLFSLPHPVKRKTKKGLGQGDPYKMQYPNSVRLRRRIFDAQERLDEYVFRDASNDPNTTNTAFRARPSRNGVESWASSWSKFDPAAKVPVIETFEPAESRAVRKLDKNELVAVQLPYVAMIAANAKDAARAVVIPEELVQFATLSGDSKNFQSWKQSQGYGKANRNPSRQDHAALEGVEKLVLSDDDIEDD